MTSGWDSPDWDEATRTVVAARLSPPPLKYLKPDQAELVEAIGLRLVPQDTRRAEDRIRLAPVLDIKLWHDQRDGSRYATLPPQREAWRLAFKGFDETSRSFYGRAFRELSDDEKDRVLKSVESGTPPGESWSSFSSADFFQTMLLSVLVGAYYAHPTAWAETGYTGPAARRGHVRQWEGGVDPWDRVKRRQDRTP